MRLQAIQRSVKARLRHPGWWSAAIALGMVPGLFWLLLPGPHTLKMFLGFLWILSVSILSLFLCPSPWQWTSDDRPLAGWWRGLFQLLIFCFLLGVLIAPMGWLAGKETPAEAFRLGGIVGVSIPFLLLMGPAGWVVARAERLAQEALEALEAQAKARETQWMSHRGAFSPRLLFSHLNHLATLAGKNAQVAEQGLVDLAAMYRRWLMEAELPLVPLSTERSLTEQYLALERGRWGDRLRLRWHLDPDLDGFQVPPLFLQPLLEMLLGPEPSSELDVELRESRLSPGVMGLRVRIQGTAPSPDESMFQPLRQRLQSILGRDAEATVAPCPGGWEAAFRLPAMKIQAEP